MASIIDGTNSDVDRVVCVMKVLDDADVGWPLFTGHQIDAWTDASNEDVMSG